MFAATDSMGAVVLSLSRTRSVRLNVISHLLTHVPYEDVPAEKVTLPKRKIGRYKAADYPFKYVPVSASRSAEQKHGKAK